MSSCRYAIPPGREVKLSRPRRLQNLRKRIKAAQATGSVRLFSIRHEFPTEWAMFKSAVISVASPTAALALNLLPQHYPFWAQGLLAAGAVLVEQVEFFAEMTDQAVSVNLCDKADKSGKMKFWPRIRS